MYEKCNPSHPDKLADRIAGALVDETYRLNNSPKAAFEVLLGHGVCHIIAETSEKLDKNFVYDTVHRICKDDNIYVLYDEYLQDPILASNQDDKMRCGDNGIFKGVPVNKEEELLTDIAKAIYEFYPYDGKYVLHGKKLIICQSNCNTLELKTIMKEKFPEYEIIVNPLGNWTGGTSVDVGAVNRKLGSDMAQAVTGGGINGKDITKADVSINIFCFLKAQELSQEIQASCAIGDETVTFSLQNGENFTLPYNLIASRALQYIRQLGGFEKLAEWGLVKTILH